jgi:hypothetical protein
MVIVTIPACGDIGFALLHPPKNPGQFEFFEAGKWVLFTGCMVGTRGLALAVTTQTKLTHATPLHHSRLALADARGVAARPSATDQGANVYRRLDNSAPTNDSNSVAI